MELSTFQFPHQVLTAALVVLSQSTGVGVAGYLFAVQVTSCMQRTLLGIGDMLHSSNGMTVSLRVQHALLLFRDSSCAVALHVHCVHLQATPAGNTLFWAIKSAALSTTI